MPAEKDAEGFEIDFLDENPVQGLHLGVKIQDFAAAGFEIGEEAEFLCKDGPPDFRSREKYHCHFGILFRILLGIGCLVFFLFRTGNNPAMGIDQGGIEYEKADIAGMVQDVGKFVESHIQTDDAVKIAFHILDRHGTRQTKADIIIRAHIGLSQTGRSESLPRMYQGLFRGSNPGR